MADVKEDPVDEPQEEEMVEAPPVEAEDAGAEGADAGAEDADADGGDAPEVDDGAEAMEGGTDVAATEEAGGEGGEGQEGDEMVAGEEKAQPEAAEGDEQKEEVAEEKGNGKATGGQDALARPPHGSEIFVGGIAPDVTEEDLRNLCAECGDIYEIRILKDKETSRNKGFAFVTFTTRQAAEKALVNFTDKELKGRKLRFSTSQSRHRLFIGNVPKAWSKEELEQGLEGAGGGVEKVELLMEPRNPGRNRGFAFVEYYNHQCAELARRNMSKPTFRLGGNTPTINWAEARPEPDTATMLQVKVVYVKNLSENVTEEQLKELFGKHGEIAKVVLPPPKPGQGKRDFGFIHYTDRSSALAAIERTEKYELDGRDLEVSLAKPPPEKRPVDAGPPPGPGRRDGGYPSYRPQGQVYGGGGYGPTRGGGGGSYGADPYPPPRAGGYGPQPVIYGRGPTPSNMGLVPMLLPDGRVGYVLQQPGQAVAPSQGGYGARRGEGGARSAAPAPYSSQGTRRYRPY